MSVSTMSLSRPLIGSFLSLSSLLYRNAGLFKVILFTGCLTWVKPHPFISLASVMGACLSGGCLYIDYDFHTISSVFCVCVCLETTGRVCRFFNTARGCYRGDACPYHHLQQGVYFDILQKISACNTILGKYHTVLHTTPL